MLNFFAGLFGAVPEKAGAHIALIRTPFALFSPIAGHVRHRFLTYPHVRDQGTLVRLPIQKPAELGLRTYVAVDWATTFECQLCDKLAELPSGSCQLDTVCPGHVCFDACGRIRTVGNSTYSDRGPAMEARSAVLLVR